MRLPVRVLYYSVYKINYCLSVSLFLVVVSQTLMVGHSERTICYDVEDNISGTITHVSAFKLL
jgi:hypothetical protein